MPGRVSGAGKAASTGRQDLREVIKMKVFRNRFFVAIVLAAVVIFTAQLFYASYNFRHAYRLSADEALIRQTGNLGVLLGEHLMFVAGQSLVSTSLWADEASEAASGDIVAALQDFLQMNSLVQGAGICRLDGDGSGIYAYKTQEGVKSVTLNAAESQEYFILVYENSPENAASSIRWNSETSSLLGQSNILSALIPVYIDGQQAGFSRLDISVDALQQYASGLKPGDTGYAFVARDKSDFEKYLKQEGSTDSDTGNITETAQKLAREKESGLFRSTLAGQEHNIAIAPIGATGLMMVFVLPQADAYGGINMALGQTALALFFSLLVFLAVFYVIMQRKIDSPLADLIQTVQELARGDSSAPQRYPHRHNEQMSVLLDAVVNMPRNILALVDDLKEKNREILIQRDEIHVLYEKTAAMNDELLDTIREKELLYARLQDSYLDTVHALANSIEASDHYTQGHCQRVKTYALDIARAMKVDEAEMKILEYAALLHDVGKIGIQPSVLNKGSGLDQAELRQMSQHPMIGFHILEGIDFLESCRRIVLQHHEHWDGQGYPYGLKGEDIHLFSRIITVADSYDAMTTSRPYRKVPLSKEEAVAELLNNRGKQFDPRVVDTFVGLV